jgi:hypothetical protein
MAKTKTPDQTLMGACREAIQALGTEVKNDAVKDWFKEHYPNFDTTKPAWPSSVAQARTEARMKAPGAGGEVAASAPAVGPAKKRPGRPKGSKNRGAGSATKAVTQSRRLAPAPARPANGQTTLQVQLRQLAGIVGRDETLKIVDHMLS